MILHAFTEFRMEPETAQVIFTNSRVSLKRGDFHKVSSIQNEDGPFDLREAWKRGFLDEMRPKQRSRGPASVENVKCTTNLKAPHWG